jgi:hypothetical protein
LTLNLKEYFKIYFKQYKKKSSEPPHKVIGELQYLGGWILTISILSEFKSIAVAGNNG